MFKENGRDGKGEDFRFKVSRFQSFKVSMTQRFGDWERDGLVEHSREPQNGDCEIGL
jgi:hypothetical protein